MLFSSIPRNVSHRVHEQTLTANERLHSRRKDSHPQLSTCGTGNGSHMAKFAFVRCRFPLLLPPQIWPEHVEDRLLCLELLNATQLNVMTSPPDSTILQASRSCLSTQGQSLAMARPPAGRCLLCHKNPFPESLFDDHKFTRPIRRLHRSR